MVASVGFRHGYRGLVVSSSSMEPAIPVGSLVVIRPETAPQQDDVITYRLAAASPSLLTHRVTKVIQDGDQEVLETKGDAVELPDRKLVAVEDVVGKVVVVMPQVGKLVAFTRSPFGVTALVIIPATVVVYEELKAVGKHIAHMRKEH